MKKLNILMFCLLLVVAFLMLTFSYRTEKTLNTKLPEQNQEDITPPKEDEPIIDEPVTPPKEDNPTTDKPITPPKEDNPTIDNPVVPPKEDEPIIDDPIEELTISEKVEKNIKEMSIEEKISQMLIVGYNNSEKDKLISSIKKHGIGGVILFSNNITTLTETRNIVASLKNSSKIPLIVSTDQEGGSVQRLKKLKGATDIPYMYYLGLTEDEALARETGALVAEELRTIGVNVDFAPVLDIYSNPDNKVIGKRSFGTSSETVSKMAINFAKGLESKGVIATYKHFPGHGDTSTDSHYKLPIINKSYADLQKLELIPFQNAINNNAKIIMVGHLALPEVTKNNVPASLSKTIITDILKNSMGYQGLVITDALNMNALTSNYTEEQIIIKAIEAGNDLLLMPKDTERAISIIKSNVSEERINASLRKILALKYTYLNNDNFLGSEYLGSKKHQEIISKIKVSE